MKLLFVVSSLVALASASWEPIYEKYHGPLHYPKIHDGVPVEPTAVQHARQAHLMALSQASHNDKYEHNDYDEHHEEHKWQGPKHYPVIHKGVPVEPAEVQHAREAHLKVLSHASHNDYHYDQHQGHKWHGPMHIPKIHNGVPVEPVEVQHARAAHLKALTESHHNSHEISHHYRKRRGAESYAHFSSVVEHEVPVYYNHHADSHYNDDSQNYGNHEDQIHTPSYGHHSYGYEQIHAPVYGHHEDEEHQEIPLIGHDGTPVDTPEVQHAKAAHLAAHAAAKSKHY